MIFLKAGIMIFVPEEVEHLDLSRLDEQIVGVKIKSFGQMLEARGFDAVEVLMAIKPSAAEGTRLRFRKHAWAIHNLIGHPVMQVLAWMGLKRQAIWFHDFTAPAARDIRSA